MSRSNRTAAALASVAALAGTAAAIGAVSAPLAQAASQPTIKVNPKQPFVDDSVSASMTVKSRLEAGYHYEVSIIGVSGYECSTVVSKSLKSRPAKGKKLAFGFTPYEDEVNEAEEWCQGKATIWVFSVKNGSKQSGKVVAFKDVRFRAKP